MLFSIVVPTRNRPAQLASLLESIACLAYPRREFEIIIVDDGGDPAAAAVVVRFSERMDVRYLACTHQGPAAARQAGTMEARGRFLAFTDDDCTVDRNWLSALERTLHENPGCAVGGRTQNALTGNLFAEATERVLRYLYGYFEAHPAAPRFFSTNNVAVPADAFRLVGGLDPLWSNSGGEDRDLFFRWRHHGYGMVFDPRVIVYHSHQLTWLTFIDQHVRYGRGAFLFHDRHTRTSRGRLRLAPISFYLRLPLAAFSSRPSWREIPVAGLLVVAQASNAAGFFCEALGKSIRRRRASADAIRASERQVIDCRSAGDNRTMSGRA